MAVEVDFPFLVAACFLAATAGFDAPAAACFPVFGTTVAFDALDDEEVLADLEAVAVALGVFFTAGAFVAAEARVFLVVRKLLFTVLATDAREVEAFWEVPPRMGFPSWAKGFVQCPSDEIKRYEICQLLGTRSIAFKLSGCREQERWEGRVSPKAILYHSV